MMPPLPHFRPESFVASFQGRSAVLIRYPPINALWHPRSANTARSIIAGG